MWGVLSAAGVFTAAPKGEEQARAWAGYKFPTTIGPIGEVIHFQAK